MSEVVTLTLRAPLTQVLDFEGILPERTALLTETEIAALPVWLGGQPQTIGNLFAVRGERASHLRIEGDLTRAVRVGAGMSTGRLVVAGHVGDEAGLAMSGGLLVVEGNAGDRLCAASAGASKGMTGGEAVVHGSAGSEAGMRCRRGLIAIGGDSGAHTARDIIAGTVVVGGRIGAEAGQRSKRGSIVALSGIDVPSTYRYACTYDPPYVRLLLTHLGRIHRFAVPKAALGGRYRRYCGDAGEPGKGEILQLA